MTIQSSGIGGPSAAVVITELLELGARVLVRLGTCRGLGTELALGDLVVAREVIAADGTSQALGAQPRLAGDPQLTAALAASSAAAPRTVVSADLFYDVPAGDTARWRRDGAAVLDMETATLFALAARHGLRAASILVVAELDSPARPRLAGDALREAELPMGAAAAGALSSLTAGPADPQRSRSVPDAFR